MEIGNWKLEIRNWKLEIGNWKALKADFCTISNFSISNFQFPISNFSISNFQFPISNFQFLQFPNSPSASASRAASLRNVTGLLTPTPENLTNWKIEPSIGISPKKNPNNDWQSVSSCGIVVDFTDTHSTSLSTLRLCNNGQLPCTYQ